MLNEYSTYQTVYNHKNKSKTYTIIPFNVEACLFTKDNFVNFKKEYSFEGVEGIYILYGEEQYYIGESGDVKSRLNQHLASETKSFWTKTFVITSVHFNQTTRKHFEAWLLDEPDEVNFGTFKNVNSQMNQKQKQNSTLYNHNVHNHFENVLIEFLKIIDNDFPDEAPFGEVEELNNDHYFEFKGDKKSFNGILKVDSNGHFILCEGSILHGEQTEWIKSSNRYERIQSILSNENLVKKLEDGNYKLIRDLEPYKKPTFLACLVSGGSVNGWDVFKNRKDSKTLDEVHRRPDSYASKIDKYNHTSNLILTFENEIKSKFGEKIYLKETVHYKSISYSNSESKIIAYIRPFKDYFRLYTNDEKVANSSDDLIELDKLHWGNAKWYIEFDNISKIKEFILRLNL